MRGAKRSETCKCGEMASQAEVMVGTAEVGISLASLDSRRRVEAKCFKQNFDVYIKDLVLC